MSDALFENTKMAAYFLWEYTQHDNALALWTCAEDIAYYLEITEIFAPAGIEAIKAKGVYDYEYISFVRHIAYRIYVYTGVDDAETNWFAAEKLINNNEWNVSVTNIAGIYNDNRSSFDSLTGIRSEQVKQYHSQMKEPPDINQTSVLL